MAQAIIQFSDKVFIHAKQCSFAFHKTNYYTFYQKYSKDTKLMKWPPASLDVNPIENLRHIVLTLLQAVFIGFIKTPEMLIK